MICVETVRKYCNGNITKIENYYTAIKDNTQTWDCHHRLETHTSDGIRRKVDISATELKRLGCFYQRPENELIFIKQAEHKYLHQKGKPLSDEHKKRISIMNRLNVATRCNENMRKKLSEYHKAHPNKTFLGKHHTEESKRLLSDSHKGICKNKHWFNNGIVEVMNYECPDGFVKGRLYHTRSTK